MYVLYNLRNQNCAKFKITKSILNAWRLNINKFNDKQKEWKEECRRILKIYQVRSGINQFDGDRWVTKKKKSREIKRNVNEIEIVRVVNINTYRTVSSWDSASPCNEILPPWWYHSTEELSGSKCGIQKNTFSTPYGNSRVNRANPSWTCNSSIR